MSSQIASENVRAEVVRKGMPLGWRLALYTAVIVALVMGAVTAFQETKNTTYERQQLIGGLRSSLLPLAARLEAAGSIREMEQDLQLFHQSYRRAGIESRHLTLTAPDGGVLFSTLPSEPQVAAYMRVDLPITNSQLGPGAAELSIYQDQSAWQAHIHSRWRRGLFHFVATLVSILLALQIAIRVLVTAPLERLLEGIRKTEMGYWGEVADPGGAWEIRWVVWRFQNMGRELERTVQHLLAAEKRARGAAAADRMPLRQAAAESPDSRTPTATGRLDPPTYPASRLLAVCSRLEGVHEPSSTDRHLAQAAVGRHAFAAEALGDMTLKCRLENASLRILEPTAYHDLAQRVEAYTSSRRNSLQHCQERLRTVLEQNMVPVVELHARNKHIAGIHAKMRSKGLEFTQIHDLFALRVVVPSESDCYWALGLVHETFAPVVGRFKDYIAAPKPNGYRSLHTCVRVEDTLVVEIQIRSLAMHRSAENGATSHLNYKQENRSMTMAKRRKGLSAISIAATAKKMFDKSHRTQETG